MNMLIPVLAVVAANFSADTGKIRPALHSSGFGPTICSQTTMDLDDVKAMGFKYARTHDWALINPNQRVCDYFHIFPLMHLDVRDPKNYFFAPTDYLLTRTREEAGLDVFFRLGTSIEHSGKKVHFNSTIPADFAKVAETFAATVRHYNRGWANGFKWNIKYWEIWNEPEGIRNMWTPPGGVSDAGIERQAQESRAKFVEFFVVCLKRLKEEFGDTIKVGGPALCSFNTLWLNEILSACRDAGVAPDFISWHGYRHNPMRLNNEAEDARKLCDSFGFTKCELIVNEWHYFGENYTWQDLRSSDPAIKARIWEGPDGHNGIRSACFTLAVLANMQRSKLDQAYYYGCRHTGAWGFKDELQRKYKVFYALKLFGDIVKNYSTICESVSEGTVTTFAVKDRNGKKALLVVDYGGASRRVAVSVKGVAPGAVAKCTLLDHHHDLVPHEASFKDGTLELVKPDFNSAAFFVEFDDSAAPAAAVCSEKNCRPAAGECCAGCGKYRFLAFNIWGDYYRNPPRERDLQQVAVIRESDPDFVGLQEVTPNFWKSRLITGLVEAGYECVGADMGPNDKHPDAFNPVFFRSSRFELVEKGVKWFHPELDDSKGVVWAALREKATGCRFVVFASHFWWQTKGVGDDYLRLSNARTLFEQVCAAARKHGAVVVGGGDLNSPVTSSALAELKKLGWSDAQEQSPDTDPRATWHGYPVRDAGGAFRGLPPETSKEKQWLDHVFYSPENVRPVRFTIDSTQKALDVSDHSPVIFDFTL